METICVTDLGLLQVGSHVCLLSSGGILSPLLLIFFKKIIFIWLLQVFLWHMGIQFPGPGIDPGPLCWEHGVLATGLPGKSQLPLFQLCAF